MVRQELQFESNGKEKFALLILTLITRHRGRGQLFEKVCVATTIFSTIQRALSLALVALLLTKKLIT